MIEQYAVMITRFPLFQGFTVDGARILLECGEVKEFSPGEMVIKEGVEPTFVLLVLTGKLQVFVQRQGRDLILTDAIPRTSFGELAVLCGIPRSASVRATGVMGASRLSQLAPPRWVLLAADIPRITPHLDRERSVR